MPRSEDAKDVDRDPLWSAVAEPPLSKRRQSRRSPNLRMLRIALASTQARRRNLFRESRLLGAIERFRARNHDPFDWLEARASHADPRIQALIRTAATLAPRA